MQRYLLEDGGKNAETPAARSVEELLSSMLQNSRVRGLAQAAHSSRGTTGLTPHSACLRF